MIDTHAHINTEAFSEDIEEVIERAKTAGLENIIIPAIEPKEFDSMFQLAEKHDFIYCSIGVHPHNASEVDSKILQEIEERSHHPKVKAIGEIGLDYYYDFTPKDVQIKAFRDQIEIAKSRDLPCIIHNRDSNDDMINVLTAEQNGNLNGVMHCFSGDVDMLKRALDLNMHISFTGNITFKKTDLDAQVAATPLERLMLETDSPYMTPVPFRGKRNEPARVELVAQKIAEIKQISIGEVISMTTENAKRFFGLLSFLFLFFFTSNISFAQEEERSNEGYNQDVYQDEEYNATDDEFIEDELEEDFMPFRKYLGIGPVLGINTIVETYYRETSEDEISAEGMLSYGGTLSYGITNYCVLEFAYVFTNRTDLAEKLKNQIQDSKYHNFEFVAHWIANPNSRIGFFGTTGLAYHLNQIGNQFGTDDHSNFSFTSGVGIYVNLDTPIGLFTPVMEWRLNFLMNRSDIIDTIEENGQLIENEIEASTFFSIPRLTIKYFPNW